MNSRSTATAAKLKPGTLFEVYHDIRVSKRSKNKLLKYETVMLTPGDILLYLGEVEYNSMFGEFLTGSGDVCYVELAYHHCFLEEK